MDSAIVGQAAALFETPFKWTAFLELADLRQELVHHWYAEFRFAADRYFRDHQVVNWGFVPWGNTDMKWFLTEWEDASFSPGLGYGMEFQLRVWGDEGLYDMPKLKELLRSTEYSPLLSAIERGELLPQGEGVREIRNFSFDDASGAPFTYESLAWYAGNQTDELVAQVAKKIDRFRRDETLTQLLGKLNRETRKK